MTPAELALWQQLNVLAETDAVAAHVIAYYRGGHTTVAETLLRGLLAYGQVTEVLRKQLLDAESGRPRVFYLADSRT